MHKHPNTFIHKFSRLCSNVLQWLPKNYYFHCFNIFVEKKTKISLVKIFKMHTINPIIFSRYSEYIMLNYVKIYN